MIRMINGWPVSHPCLPNELKKNTTGNRARFLMQIMKISKQYFEQNHMSGFLNKKDKKTKHQEPPPPPGSSTSRQRDADSWGREFSGHGAGAWSGHWSAPKGAAGGAPVGGMIPPPKKGEIKHSKFENNPRMEEKCATKTHSWFLKKFNEDA